MIAFPEDAPAQFLKFGRECTKVVPVMTSARLSSAKMPYGRCSACVARTRAATVISDRDSGVEHLRGSIPGLGRSQARVI